MYDFNVPNVEYSDPWQLSLSERTKTLLSGSVRIMYYYERADNSTFRYRAYNMAQVINEKIKPVSAAYFFHEDLPGIERLVDAIDILVVVRARYTKELSRLISKVKNKGKRVIFDVDDLVFDARYVHLVMDTLDQDPGFLPAINIWHSDFGRVRASLDLCDRVITTNPYLASAVEKLTNKPTSVIPNFLNREQLEYSNLIYIEKQRNGFRRKNGISIGYFSGTPTHNKDLSIAIEAIVNILRANRNVSLRLVGYMDLDPRLRKLGSQVEQIPLQDFINLQRYIGDVEINIVPLQNNYFTNCKSELKFFEAAVTGTLTIASPIYTYANAIRSGENGFLSRDHEWFINLERSIEYIDSISEILDTARAYSVDHYGWYNQVSVIENALFS